MVSVHIVTRLEGSLKLTFPNLVVEVKSADSVRDVFQEYWSLKPPFASIDVNMGGTGRHPGQEVGWVELIFLIFRMVYFQGFNIFSRFFLELKQSLLYQIDYFLVIIALRYFFGPMSAVLTIVKYLIFLIRVVNFL